MSPKPIRITAPWLFVAGFLLLGAGYLLGTAMRPARFGLARRVHEAEGARGRPAGQGEGGAGTDRSEPRPSDERGDLAQTETSIVRFEGEGLKLAHLRVEPVGYGSPQPRLAVTGIVEPNPAGVVKVTPRVAGKITSIRVNVGDTVRPGQPLATQASIELAQAQAAYRQASARRAVAESDLQRQKKLAGLGAFESPAVEAARARATAARAEVDTARSEVIVARAGVAEAESQLRALQAAVEQALSQAQVARSRFSRADLLLKEGIVSQQAWEQARADDQRSQADVTAAHAIVAQGQAKVGTAQAGLQAARLKLAAATQQGRIATQALGREEAVHRGRYMTSKEIVAAEGNLRQAQLEQRAAMDNIRLLGGVPGDGDLLTITAPLGGRITERLVTLGETVTPDRPLFTMMDLRTVWVQLNIYQEDLPSIRTGQQVLVTADTAPGRTFSGTVSSIGDLVDSATRTVRVRAVIGNAGAQLKPQTFIRGIIATGHLARGLTVPRDAVQRVEGKWVVFTPAGKPGEFRPRPVEIGPERGDRVEIRAGLKAGDRIVTRNAFLVKAQAMKGELGDEDEEKGPER